MLDRIKSTLASLAPAEQRLRKLLLSDLRTFAGLPVVALAERAQVSTPKVVRFCRSVGYDGLRDFKLKLAVSLSEGVPFNHRNVGAPDITVAAFLKCRNDASTAAIDKAVDAITLAHEKKKRLKFFGSGSSGIVAQDAQHKFFRLGFHTIAQSDGHLQIMSASLLGPGDCLVVVSNSGRTRDLQDACKIVRKKSMTAVVITASGSPLVQTGHIHLAADDPESYERFSAMVSRLLHLMIIKVLATSVALRIGSAQLQLLLRNMKQNLLNKRYS